MILPHVQFLVHPWNPPVLLFRASFWSGSCELRPLRIFRMTFLILILSSLLLNTTCFKQSRERQRFLLYRVTYNLCQIFFFLLFVCFYNPLKNVKNHSWIWPQSSEQQTPASLPTLGFLWGWPSHTDIPHTLPGSQCPSFCIRCFKTPRLCFFPFHLNHYKRSPYHSPPWKSSICPIMCRIKYRLFLCKHAFGSPSHFSIVHTPWRHHKETHHSANTLQFPQAFLSLRTCCCFCLECPSFLSSLLFLLFKKKKILNWFTPYGAAVHIYLLGPTEMSSHPWSIPDPSSTAVWSSWKQVSQGFAFPVPGLVVFNWSGFKFSSFTDQLWDDRLSSSLVPSQGNRDCRDD